MAEDIGGEILIEDAALAGGFVQVPVAIFFDPDLKDGPVRTYGALLWYAWKQGRAPEQEVMAQELGMGLRTIQRHLKDLQNAGYIAVEQLGLGKANRYVIKALGPDLPKLAGLARQNWRVQAASSGVSLEVLDSTKDIKNENERPSTPTQEEKVSSTHPDPTDSLSLSSIAYTTSQRLNNGQQLRSILGFLEGPNGDPAFTPEIASQAFDHTIARHEDEPLNTPIAFFYKTCQLLREKATTEAETAKEERQRQFTVALSVAQLYLGDNGDIAAAHTAVEEHWPDLADSVIAELKNRNT